MSKSSRKNSLPPTSHPPATRGKTSLVVTVFAVAAVAVGGFVWIQKDSASVETPPAQTAAAASTATQAQSPVDPPPPAIAPKPHPQKDFPPLRLPGYPLGRSPEVITAAYRFAAEHPEILTYIPCFCGCERMGHRGNEDCFVKSRAPNGDVQEWEDHGMECNVCLDVATQAMQMHASGASVRSIRAAVESKWAAQAPSHTHTPTPRPPQ